MPLVHPGSPQAVHAVWGVFSSFTGHGMVATCWGQGCKSSVLPEIRWEVPCRHSECRSGKGVGGFLSFSKPPSTPFRRSKVEVHRFKFIRLPSDRKIVTYESALNLYRESTTSDSSRDGRRRSGERCTPAVGTRPMRFSSGWRRRLEGLGRRSGVGRGRRSVEPATRADDV